MTDHPRSARENASPPYIQDFSVSDPLFPRQRVAYSTEQLVRLVGSADELFGRDVAIDVRTVAVQAESGAWYNFATVLRVEDVECGPERMSRIDFPGLTLLSFTGRASTIQTADDLRIALTQWRSALEAPSGYTLQESVYFHRYPSRSEWAEDPCVVFDVHERSDDRMAFGTSDGPFFDVTSNLFAESVGELAFEWLAIPAVRRETSVTHTYRVVVPDPRARITELEVTDLGAEITVTGRYSGPLFCGAHAKTYRAEVVRQSVPIEQGVAWFEFPGLVRTIEVWVITAESEWLDRYYETEYGHAWATPKLEPAESIAGTAEAALVAALGSGESDRVEFKPFMLLTRGNKKAQEVLATVSAFANTRGG